MTPTQERASRYVWNPMTRMADVLGRQRVWVQGRGSLLYDEQGREFVDGCGSLWYANVGYGRDEIVDAVAAQMRRLPAWMMFGDNVTPPAVDLAERLAGLTPGSLNRIYYTCGGSESIETAVKIARQYFCLLGHPERSKIVSRLGSYHGSTYGALSATATTHNRRMFGPLVPGFLHVPPFSIEALEETIAFESAETIAAVVVDPSLAASGLVFPPDDYLPRLRELCDRHGILLVSDEVVCGFGRIGQWFGVDHWEVRPDMMAMAKGIASGYVPLGAVAVSDEIFEPFADPSNPDNGFYHGNTYAGHAACCAGALANIDIIEREGLVERSAVEGVYFHDLLSGLVDECDLVREVRGGLGIVAAVQLDAPPRRRWLRPWPGGAYEHGVLVRAYRQCAHSCRHRS